MKIHMTISIGLIYLFTLQFISIESTTNIGYCLSGPPENEDKPFILVAAPYKIRANSTYRIGVSGQDIVSPSTMQISILNSNSNQTIFSETAMLNENKTHADLDFQTGSLTNAKYKLKVKVLDGLDFDKTENIIYDAKVLSIFIQTDKAIYKPGQKVKFRVILVNPELEPVDNRPLNVHIEDSKRNRVKQWKGKTTVNGIMSGELQLSSEPLLGDWKMFVDAGEGQKTTKMITIAEYVLPKAEVKIKLPSYATYNSSKIVTTVEAKYTYGKSLKGTVELTAEYPGWSNSKRTFRYSGDIHGSKDIEVDLVKDLNLDQRRFDRDIELHAEVIEKLTKKSYEANNKIKIYKNPIKMELVKTSNTFKPGLRYTAFLKVSTQDDIPVPDAGPVKLKYNYGNLGEKEMDVTLKKGIAMIDFYPPYEKGVTNINMRGKYKDNDEVYLDNIQSAKSPSNNFLQLTKSDDSPVNMGDNIILNVNATEKLSSISYQILGKGEILISGTEIINPPSKCFSIMFQTDQKMAPNVRAIIYYVRRGNEEVVVDALNIAVEGVFRTPVTVGSNMKTVMPGEEVSIDVMSKPNAEVFVLGVDQSVLLLKSGNDLDKNEIMKEIQRFDSGSSSNRPSYGWRSAWWMSADTASELIREAGLVMMTNGFIHSGSYYGGGGYGINRVNVAYDVFTSPQPRPMAAVGFGGPISVPRPPPITVRKKFPETWLWDQKLIGDDGKASFVSKIPDTITSWIVSAFAMDETTGLGLADEKAKVTVFRPFFVSLNLPYSIIREEAIALQVLVFNYQDEAVDAELVMENNKDQFYFTVATNEIDDHVKEIQQKTQMVKKIQVPANDGASVSFLITPTKVGYMDIKVTGTAKTSKGVMAGDAILKKLLVKPEGQTEHFNEAVLINLDSKGSEGKKRIKRSVSVEVPEDAVPDSEYVAISAIGDIMGPQINSNNLLRMPYGCGEQNMINFVPNIVTLKYLTKTGRLKPEQEKKAKANMEAGYQRELRYQRHDGSFSAFGDRDDVGSTFLTAYVMKSFQQAKEFITVDKKVMEQGINWLMQQQKEDGSFSEKHVVHHKDLQGGLNKSPSALTAYVLSAVLQDPANIVTYENEIKNATDYLAKRLNADADIYETSLITFALHLANHEKKNKAYEQLSKLATTSGGFMRWQVQVEVKAPKRYSWSVPKSNDVEMTAYALSTMVMRGRIEEAVPVLMWLVSKQNANGGFSSTQDTVIGIQALADIASELSNKDPNLKVAYKTEKGESRNFYISKDNCLVLQKVELNRKMRSVEVEAEGSGVGVVQVLWHYNNANNSVETPFDVRANVNAESKDSVNLAVCVKLNSGLSTGMAVMEVEAPSGYNIRSNSWNVKGVKRIENENSNTKLVVYFDAITNEDICMNLVNYREFHVAKQKPAPIYVYDYYNRNKNSRVFYPSVPSSLCDICEMDDCIKCEF